MCCHPFFIYTVCGHSVFSSDPLVLCPDAGIPPDGNHSTVCELVAHPYKSWKVDNLCPPCQARKDFLLRRMESSQIVTFDEWRWKVSYGLNSDGEDYWNKRTEAKKKTEEEQLRSPKRWKDKRLSWRSNKKGKGRGKARGET